MGVYFVRRKFERPLYVHNNRKFDKSLVSEKRCIIFVTLFTPCLGGGKGGWANMLLPHNKGDGGFIPNFTSDLDYSSLKPLIRGYLCLYIYP